VIVTVAALVVVADQFSKSVEQTSLASGPFHVLGPLDLELSYNRGAAFGIGSGVTPIILVVGAALIVIVAGFGRPVHTRLATVASGLLAGGAVSNLGDRLFRSNGGAVIDWIHLSHWPTFNIADSCIVVGVVMLVVSNWGARPD
jgi:signal peptidase II